MEPRIDTLARLLADAPDEVFLQPHNVPDPDAIAACFGLQHLLRRRGISAEIVYTHAMEKANALKMIELFGITMHQARNVATLGGSDWVVLVDVQKGNANVTNLAGEEVAVVDHHEHGGDQGYRYADIRPDIGACATIIADYFVEAGEELPSTVGTALLYGILMDTDSMTRGVSSLDVEMFYTLYGGSTISMIAELKGNQISREDLDDYARAFSQVEVYGPIGFLRLDNANDSLLGAASDIVITISGVDVVIAYSIRTDGIKFSVRSIAPAVRASDCVRFILSGHGIGGGHATMAGGFLPADSVQADRGVDTFVRYRSISYVEDRLTAGSP